jgi:hypothetical protein
MPDATVVFTSLNHARKVKPTRFDSFMRILAAVPGSSLSLLARHNSTGANLRPPPARLPPPPRAAAAAHTHRRAAAGRRRRRAGWRPRVSPSRVCWTSAGTWSDSARRPPPPYCCPYPCPYCTLTPSLPSRSGLFLDTFPYSAHTTCSEALFAGLPVLSRPGQTFASRVRPAPRPALPPAQARERQPDDSRRARERSVGGVCV